MPVTTSYPGVYVTEVPSGIHTITGVATSITAFIGSAARGPSDQPVTINSYSDFERTFGGLWVQSSLGYAVRDFYRNGGSKGIIVRLFHDNYADATARASAAAAATATAKAAKGASAAAAAAAAATTAGTYTSGPDIAAAMRVSDAAQAASLADGATSATVGAAATAAAATATPLDSAQLVVDTLTLNARYPGAWGNSLRARVEYIKNSDGTFAPDLFNLLVRDGTTGTVETFLNLTVVPGSARQVDLVLASDSQLVTAAGLPSARPAQSANPDPSRHQFDVWADNFIAEVPADNTTTPPTPAVPQQDSTNAVVLPAGMASDGGALDTNDFNGPGLAAGKSGLYSLENADLFNLLCIPPYLAGATGANDGDIEYAALVPDAVAYCQQRRAVLVVDSPHGWGDSAAAVTGFTGAQVATTSNSAALYFPRMLSPDPLRGNRMGELVPCGAVAGIMARTDSARGVWKAPAGLEATVNGATSLTVPLTDAENGQLNPLGVNCLRSFPASGTVVWGARTLEGNDQLASEWKYLPVRRTALFIEESLYRGTQWVVFEPNDEPLWAQIRLNVGAFMHDLFRQGAFQGSTPTDAYFVKCDSETTTQNDINSGVVNILVGFAPLKPAEFVIISLQQIAGAVQA
ncbi:phage tail sheath subtilisin-like domain-containing protein [Arthrobacter sp. LAPM80]|uniref:phage tail sheath family protein n=1 Tax=Arthrobacter sp. LAPM80 TaxID=3141788 RepID=UPI00398B6AC8